VLASGGLPCCTLHLFLCSRASLTLAVPLGVLPFLSGPAGCVQRCAARLALHTLQSTLSLFLAADGTPAGYYYSKGSDPSLWLVYLEVTICAHSTVLAPALTRPVRC